MDNLLDFIKAHYHWFVLLLLETTSLVILFQYNNYHNAAWTMTSNSVAGAVYSVESEIAQYFHFRNLNEDLTIRNAYLEREVQLLTDEIAKQKGDSVHRALSASAVLHDYKLIPAKVVSNSVDKRDNLITIDKGEEDGIRKDMGVVSGKGVVGIVYLAGPHYSVVIPALSSKSSISCTVKTRGYFGYLHWEGGASNMAYVDDVPRHANLKLYDMVVTSGYSSVFPPGIAVGKILHVLNSADGLSYRLQVHLYTDFANLRDVCVIDDSKVAERLDILRAAQDSLKITNAQE